MTLVFLSCASENEKSGLDKIGEHYNAKVSYTKSFSRKANGKNESAFNIRVENSPMLDTLTSGQTSTAIAMMFYESLTNEEKETCETVTVAIKKSTKDKSDKFRLNGQILEACLDQSKIYNFFSEKLIDEDYDKIANSVLKEFYKDTLGDEVGVFVDSLIGEHGKIKSYQLTGIGVTTEDPNNKHYIYSGFLTFKDGYKRPYIVNASVDKNKDDITGFTLEKGVQL